MDHLACTESVEIGGNMISGTKVHRHVKFNRLWNVFFYGLWYTAILVADAYQIAWLTWLLAVPFVLILGFNIVMFVSTTLLQVVIAPVNLVRAIRLGDRELLKDELYVTAAYVVQFGENFIYAGWLFWIYLMLFTDSV